MKKLAKNSTSKPLTVSPDSSNEVSNETNQHFPDNTELSTTKTTANQDDNNSNFFYKYFFLVPVKCLEPALGSSLSKTLLSATYLGSWTAIVAALTKYTDKPTSSDCNINIVINELPTPEPTSSPTPASTKAEEIKALCCNYTVSGITDNCYLGYSNNPGITNSACNTKPKCTNAANAQNNNLTCTTYDYNGDIIAEDSCNFKFDTSDANSCSPCCPKQTIEALTCVYGDDQNNDWIIETDKYCYLGNPSNSGISAGTSSCSKITNAETTGFFSCYAYTPIGTSLGRCLPFFGYDACGDCCPEPKIDALRCNYTFTDPNTQQNSSHTCYLGEAGNLGLKNSNCTQSCIAETKAQNQSLSCTEFDDYGNTISGATCDFTFTDTTSCGDCCPPIIDALKCHYMAAWESSCYLGNSANSALSYVTSCNSLTSPQDTLFYDCYKYDIQGKYLGLCDNSFTGPDECGDCCPV